jgi:nitrogen fixation protein FixH
LTTSRQLLLISAFIFTLALMPACSRKTAGSAGALHLDLAVSPERPSMNKAMRFQVHVTGPDGQPVSDAEVNGALTMKLMDMGATQLKFAPKGNGAYEASVKSLDMSGPWSMAVKARRGDATAKQSFDVNIFD